MSIISIYIDPIESNIISFSGNFRIFTTTEPISNSLNIANITEDIELNSNIDSNLRRFFRYSKDGESWSMWYDYIPSDITVISSIQLDPDSGLYFSFKYLYDDGSRDQLDNIISVNSIILQLNLRKTRIPLRIDKIHSKISCSDESCNEVLFDRDTKLNLYDTGNLSDIYLNMSRSINEFAGLPVLYFQTIPNKSGTDFIFREYSLYNVIDRKCIKVVVDENNFPTSDFMYQSSDMDYQGPFIINIDKQYFESMFGRKKEPRQKDFLYFPINNRMYEIGDASMVRGFMMIPTFWSINLIKFKPNINYNLSESDSKFLDNMILDSEKQFGEESKSQELNSIMSQQFSTTSTQNDEIRSYLDNGIVIGETEINYNYTRFINYYYNLGSIINSSNIAVVYKDKSKIGIDNDATFMFNFNIIKNSPTGEFNFISTDGNSNIFRIYGNYSNNHDTLDINLEINSNTYSLNLNQIDKDVWYSCIVSISPTYKQVGIYAFSLNYDNIEYSNITGFNLIDKSIININEPNDIIIDDNSNFSLLKSSLKMSNIRIFNRILEEEKMEFIMSQLFIKDESIIRVIDNCRPKLGAPFLMKKY